MAMSIYKIIFLILINNLLLIGCGNNTNLLNNKTHNEDSNERQKIIVKVYKDADLYNTYESKEFARLGMITLKKYYKGNAIFKIEVLFDDYFEKGKTIYIFKNNHISIVTKIKDWGKNRKTIKKCIFENNTSKNCSINEIKSILHDVNIYVNYPQEHSNIE